MLGTFIVGRAQQYDLSQQQPSNLRFIENKGQWEDYAKYIAEMNAGQIVLEPDNFTFVFYKIEEGYQALHSCENKGNCGHNHANDSPLDAHAFKIHFEGASTASTTSASKPESHHRNYFIGNDPSKWASEVKLYEQVTYNELYPGINMDVYGWGSNFKYDFRVAPGADPNEIEVRYEGLDELRLRKGNLELTTSILELKELEPYAYQLINGEKVEVACKYILEGNNVSFEFPRGYDTGYELVIDPVLVFSSYSGSTADNFGFTATYDAAGNLYGGGVVYQYQSAGSPFSGTGTYPTVGAFQTVFQGGDHDIGISKFDATGTTLLYSTYLGGSSEENPHSLFVNDNNELYMMGSSNSTDFPTTAGAYDQTINGGYDIVVVKFTAAGSALAGSTFIGGSGADGYANHPLTYNYADEARGEIILDDNSNVFVASYSQSSNFPVSSSAFQGTLRGLQDAVFFSLNADLTNRRWATYFGGSSTDAAYSLKLNQDGHIVACGGTASPTLDGTSGSIKTSSSGGFDGFVVRINEFGSTLFNTTFLGTGAYDQCYFVEVDRNNDVLVVGQTAGSYTVATSYSTPLYSNAGGKQFIHKMNKQLNTSLFSTVFGSGSSQVNISPTAFLVDRCENIYVSGWGGNVNSIGTGNTYGMPITSDAYKSTTDGSDFYFIVLEPNAQGLLYGSYFGETTSAGFGGEHVDGGTSRFDPDGVIYQAICTSCGGTDNFPTTPGAWSSTNNSDNCNLGVLKFEFNLAGTRVEADANPTNTGCVPLTVNFTSTLTSVTSVLWDFGDGGTSTLANPSHTYTDTGRFEVMLIGTDPASCNVADTAYLEVWVRDDTISAYFTPTIEVNCEEQSISVASAVTTNFGSTTYSWNMGDGTVITGPDSVYHVYAAPGSYNVSLTVQDTSSCNGIDGLTESIYIPPFVDLALDASDTSGCVPLTIDFTNTTSPTPTTTYFWDFGDGTFSTDPAPTHTYTSGGTYTVTAALYDPNSCNVTDTVTYTITVFDDIAVADYSITRNFFGCDSVEVTVWSNYPNADSHFWDFGDGFTSTDSTVTYTYSDSGVYDLMYIVTDLSQFCRPIDTAGEQIRLGPLSADISYSDTFGCVPFTVNFRSEAGIPTANHYWDFGDGVASTSERPSHTFTTVGTFTVTYAIYDSTVCNFTDTFSIQIGTKNDSAQAGFTENILEDCDSTLTIAFTNTSVDAVQYEWHFGDGTFTTDPNPIHTYNMPGTYQVMMVAIDSSRCHPRDTVYESYTLLPNAVAAFMAPASACVGYNVWFSNESDTNSTFIWDFGDGASSTEYSPVHVYTSPGTYQVILTINNPNTCDVFASDTSVIEIVPSPSALFSLDTNSYEYGLDVVFTNLSTDYDRLLWHFGDGDSSSQEDPVHQYELIGEVTPCLIAFNDVSGCSDTFCTTITITFEPIIGVPNAFSPNGDGINDIIYVEGVGFTDFLFEIYNRWGEKVFETNDPEQGWDGFYKGKQQEMDVFVYVVKAGFVDGSATQLEGNITLLR